MGKKRGILVSSLVFFSSIALSVFAEDKTVFLGAEGFLIKIDVDSIDVWNYLGAENGLPNDNITAIYKGI